MRKRKELVNDISKGENSSTISADNYLRPTELSPRRSNESNWSESMYPPGGTRNPIRKTQTVFRCVPIFQIRGKQICGAVCFPFPGPDMPLNQCEVNVLGCIRIHQASGEWRVEMTVFRFVVCGHTHIHTHREIQSAGWEYTRSLGEVKGEGVNRFGIAGTQRSRKKTYSIPITRLIRPNPPVFRRGRQSRFPFYRSPPPPSVRRPVNTPVLRPRSGNHSSGIRHSIFNFVPPYTKSRHSREIPRYFSLFDLLSTGLPHSRAHSAYLPARVLLLEYEFTAAFPPSYEGSRLSENLLPTATQPCVIPTTLPPSSNPPSPLIPYTDLSYTRAPRLQWSRTFHPFSRLPPGHAPFFSILPIFHRFLALLLPSGRVYSAK